MGMFERDGLADIDDDRRRRVRIDKDVVFAQIRMDEAGADEHAAHVFTDGVEDFSGFFICQPRFFQTGVRSSVLTDEFHEKDVPFRQQRFRRRDIRPPDTEKILIFFPCPGKDDIFPAVTDIHEPGVFEDIRIHRLESGRRNAVDLDSVFTAVSAFGIEKIGLFSRADRAAHLFNVSLVRKRVEKLERRHIEHIFLHFEVFRILAENAAFIALVFKHPHPFVIFFMHF